MIDVLNKQRLTAVDLQTIKDKLNSNEREFASELLSQDMPMLLQEIKTLREELFKAKGLLNEARITMNENCLYDCELYDRIWDYIEYQ